MRRQLIAAAALVGALALPAAAAAKGPASASLNLEDTWPVIESVLEQALGKLQAMRRDEGQAMAQELGAHHITVNAICPGSVDTSRRESTTRRERALAAQDATTPVVGLPPTGRVARPDDIARLALFLASDQSDHITGQAWNVDGGTVMH